MNIANGSIGTLFTGAVSPEWQCKGVWFSKAWRAFETSFRADAIQAEKEFTELHKILPELYAHHSPFWDPAENPELRNALHGRARDAWVKYCSHRTCAHQMIIARLTLDGSLRAFGDPGYAGAAPEWIQPRAWIHLSADKKKENILHSEGRSFWCVRIVDPSAPPADGEQRTGAVGLPEKKTATTIYRTGAPGHPTSRHIVEMELKRRATSGEMILNSMRMEANALSEWLTRKHPEAAPMQAKTIQNLFGPKWRELGGTSIPKRNA